MTEKITECIDGCIATNIGYALCDPDCKCECGLGIHHKQYQYTITFTFPDSEFAYSWKFRSPEIEIRYKDNPDTLIDHIVISETRHYDTSDIKKIIKEWRETHDE